MTTYLNRFALLTALAHLTLELSANFLPVIYPTLIDRMGLTYAQIGLVALVISLSGSLTQPFFGYLSDRWRTDWIVVGSIVWVGLTMGLVGLTPNYQLLLLLVGFAALGSAAFHPAAAALAAANTSTRRGTALSLFSVGGNLGVALSPLLVAWGIGQMGASGTLVVMPTALILAVILKLQLSTSYQTIQQKPQQPTAAKTKPTMSRSVMVSLGLIVLMVMTRSWYHLAMMTYLPEWFENQGISLVVAGQILSLFLISISIGSLLGGPLSDAVGRWPVIVGSLLLLSLGQWFFVQAPIFWQVVLASGMGMMIGASFPVTIVMAQEAWPRGVALASALTMGLGWAPGGLGAWVTGRIADQTSLGLGLTWLAVPPLLGVVAALVYALLQRRSVTPQPDKKIT